MDQLYYKPISYREEYSSDIVNRWFYYIYANLAFQPLSYNGFMNYIIARSFPDLSIHNFNHKTSHNISLYDIILFRPNRSNIVRYMEENKLGYYNKLNDAYMDTIFHTNANKENFHNFSISDFDKFNKYIGISATRYFIETYCSDPEISKTIFILKKINDSYLNKFNIEKPKVLSNIKKYREAEILLSQIIT